MGERLFNRNLPIKTRSESDDLANVYTPSSSAGKIWELLLTNRIWQRRQNDMTIRMSLPYVRWQGPLWRRLSLTDNFDEACGHTGEVLVSRP